LVDSRGLVDQPAGVRCRDDTGSCCGDGDDVLDCFTPMVHRVTTAEANQPITFPSSYFVHTAEEASHPSWSDATDAKTTADSNYM
jgi:hypothetical protein